MREREEGPGTLARASSGAFSPESMIGIVGGITIVAVCLGLFYLTTATDANTWVPVLVFLGLLVITLPICSWMSGRPVDRKLRRILMISLVLKLLMVGPRYYLNEEIYDGEGDASRYHQAGGYFVQNMFEGRFSIAGSELTNFPQSTQSIGYLTGLLYVGFGTTLVGGYLVFSWLAWLGYLFCFRSFQVAFPNAPPHRAALLIFFMPSLLFWPSSLGKEAVMVFLIGLMTLGASRILSGRGVLRGIAYATLAGIGMVNIRPHLLLISAFALLCSMLARPSGRDSRRSALVRLVILLLLIPAVVSGIGRMDTILGTTAGGTGSIDETLDETLSSTSIGGSAFAASPVRRPWDLPQATVTVLYRPFLFEARSVPTLVAGLEGALLLFATVLAARWIWEIFPVMYRYSFGAYCGGFVVAFVVAFSNIANAGILSRQRTQMFPLLMILCAAAYEHHKLRLATLARNQALLAQGESPPDGIAGTLSDPAPLPAGSGL